MINKLTSRQVAWIMAVVGLIIFFTCLGNPFQGDDMTQIVNNLPVHSIQNIKFFFTSSTFYNGQALVGTYYRPTMTTAFSLLYTFFGTATFFYHLFQIALFVAAAFMLYLFLKQFLKPVWAFFLALLFLVHPMNSQIVFSIACMQDALLALFGITALYILSRYNSMRSLLLAGLFLTLTLFSKESGAAYLVVAMLYLLIFARNRLWQLILMMIVPVGLYAILKSHAVGLFVPNAEGAPIDHMSLMSRLMTAPSIVAFYIVKFIFPWALSTCWYWTHPTFSFGGVIVPSIVDLSAIALFGYLGWRVRHHLSKKKFQLYLFFGFWALLGVLPYLQLTPLDMTACETWFCFSMIGVLAMLGIALPTFKVPLRPKWIFLGILVLISLLGIRTMIRGTDYQSQYSIALHDIAVSPDDYSAMNNIAQEMIHEGKYSEAMTYAQHSIDIFPGVGNYDNLGVARQQTGDYPGAIAAYRAALTYGDMDLVYENLSAIYLARWQDPATEAFIQKAVKLYPQDGKLWSYQAILKGAKGDNAGAKVAIERASVYSQVPGSLYYAIMSHQPLAFTLPASTTPIIIH